MSVRETSREKTVSFSPSCAGGSHRRCMLDPTECSCGCHLPVKLPASGPLLSPAPPEPPRSEGLRCDDCGAFYGSLHGLRLHRSKMHATPCPTCGVKLFGEEELAVHLAAVHHEYAAIVAAFPEEPVVEETPEPDAEPAAAEEAIPATSPLRPMVKCPDCDKEFATFNGLYGHSGVHKPRLPKSVPLPPPTAAHEAAPIGNEVAPGDLPAVPMNAEVTMFHDALGGLVGMSVNINIEAILRIVFSIEHEFPVDALRYTMDGIVRIIRATQGLPDEISNLEL